jgi:transcriptional regulator with XRE-family HTH domain
MTEQRRDIGRFIREQRKLAELSVRRLADMAGVSNPYLSQIERGLRRPSAEILQQLARALELSAETMYVQAGILDADHKTAPPSLETAIRSAQELTDDQRKALLGVYRSFRAANLAPASSAAAAAGTGLEFADDAVLTDDAVVLNHGLIDDDQIPGGKTKAVAE